MAYIRERDIWESEHKKLTLLNESKFVTATQNLVVAITLSLVGNASPLAMQEPLAASTSRDVNKEKSCEAKILPNDRLYRYTAPA